MIRALLLAVFLFGLAAPAFALDVDADPSSGATPASKTTAEYLSDLTDDSKPDRLYAARALRSQLKSALRAEARSKPGSLAHDEARAALVELSDRLPEACTTALRYDNVVAPCADILTLLEVTSALPALVERRAIETRKSVIKRLDKAIAALSALPPEPA